MRVPIDREYNQAVVTPTPTDGGGYTTAAPVYPATTVDPGAVLKMPYLDPASGTFAADLVTALINAGLMEEAP